MEKSLIKLYIVLCGRNCTVIMCSVVDRTVFCENPTRITIRTNLISDIASYGMLSAIDGKSKPMFLVYGDEVFRRSGPPEYMSATALTRVVHRDSVKNSLMDKIQKNMLVPQKPAEACKDTLRYTSFSNILECKYMREKAGVKSIS